MSTGDKALKCRECGNTFLFTQNEQVYYLERGLMHEPQRCPGCRANRRRERLGQPPRAMHEVVCSDCGATTVVPFLPRNQRPVYCSACFERYRQGNSVSV